jgi:hypothetical protein
MNIRNRLKIEGINYLMMTYEATSLTDDDMLSFPQYMELSYTLFDIPKSVKYDN